MWGPSSPEEHAVRPMGFDLDLAIEVLRRSPATLRALLDGLSEPWIRGNEGPETFSPEVARVIAKQYRDEVGPWTPFLPVLTDHPVPRS